MGRRAGTTVVSKEFAEAHKNCPGPKVLPAGVSIIKLTEQEIEANCKKLAEDLEILPSHGFGRQHAGPVAEAVLELRKKIDEFLGV